MNENIQNNKNITICFIAPTAYSLLAGKTPENIIGPDVQQIILARELIKHNFKIVFITYDEGGAPVEYIQGIKITKIHRDNYRLDILNITLKMFRIWNGMRKVNAHIYFHHGGVGIISLFFQLMETNFVYNIASDALVNTDLITKNTKEFKQSKFSLGGLDKWLNIKLADAIIIQNTYQSAILKKRFGKNGTLIKMPFPLTKGNLFEKANPPIVLWVGAMAEVKQPELFMKLAEAIPDARFQMIGGHSGNQKLYDRMKSAARRRPNLEFLGVVPFDDIGEYFDRASILVNTSMFEGFPNAFIQAWMHYVPVVSLYADPDELLCENNLGFHSKTFEQMVESVKLLLNNAQLRQKIGRNCREYVEKEHNVTNIIKIYVELFSLICKS